MINQDPFDEVLLRYRLYNSLFTHLPFDDIGLTGALLPIFSSFCKSRLNEGAYPDEIVNDFATSFNKNENQINSNDLLFRFIQYIERQIVLFDSVEDASFEKIKPLAGKGTLNAIASIMDGNSDLSELRKLIQKMSVRVVLTAHPTQFYPGEVLGIITDLDEAIRSNDVSTIEALLKQLGKTPFKRSVKPSPYDEAVSLIWYLENVFYKSIPDVVGRTLSLAKLPVLEFQNSDLIKIGFWPGGDRDGNPFVTPEITLNVAIRLKKVLFKCYYRDARVLRRRLTFKGVQEIIVEMEAALYKSAYQDEDLFYKNPGELIEQLIKVREILISGHDGLFIELIDDFILRVKVFGFHFASIDIRQHAAKHRLVWNQLAEHYKLNAGDFRDIIFSGIRIPDEHLSETADDFIGSVRAMKSIQLGNGETGCNRYIISNAAEADDVLAVLAMVQVIFNSSAPSADIIPLFESVEDLANASRVMEELFNFPVYRNHLRARNNNQTIMLGFSDGTKDGGYLQANWSILKAKEELSKTCEKAGVSVAFFDGRGGPPGRGGGNTYEFYASQSPEINSDEIQITIQGQTISSNFGKIASCSYNLEKLVCALISNKIFTSELSNITEKQRELMEQLSGLAFQKYAALKNHPGFVPYLEEATPLKWFGQTNIGSRPAKRNGQQGLQFSDLRAIPFVGSWAQMKQNIPGYFGLGTALNHIRSQGKEKEIISLFNKSEFFRSLLSNSMQSLAKCNFAPGNWLEKTDKFSEFYNLLRDEYELSKAEILKISGYSNLMGDSPSGAASVSMREEIVLPLVVIQQYALQKLNTYDLPEEERKVCEKLILRCMFGIINAARNAA
ncbi:MAG: phosphoenolpyruvate carboxylase [Bacteroidia bacterium]